MKTVKRLGRRSDGTRDARRRTPRSGPGYGPIVESVEGRTMLAVFVVTTTVDEGPGSLRAAIEASNTTAGFDEIIFNIPGTGVQTITPRSPLPAITDPVTIDATTQTGYAGTPVIEISGRRAGKGADGLVIASSDEFSASAVLGLAIYGFRGNGVVITGDSNLVIDSYIGADASVTATAGTRGNFGHGVLITGSNNFLAENLIAHNRGDGVAITGGVGNDVALNSIFSNRGLGIDLGDDGPNDPLDADAGPNTLQNAPVLTGATALSAAGCWLPARSTPRRTRSSPSPSTRARPPTARGRRCSRPSKSSPTPPATRRSPSLCPARARTTTSRRPRRASASAGTPSR